MSHEIFFKEFPKTTNKNNIQAYMNELGDNYKDPFEGGVGQGIPPIRFCDSPVYPDLDQAHQAIQNLDKGWYDQLAVLFRERKPKEDTKEIIHLKERIAKEEKSLQEFFEKNHLKHRQSKFISCPECESKVNKDYISKHSFNTCPICRADMSSQTVKDRLKNKKATLEKLRKTLQQKQRTNTTQGQVKWLVKGEVHG